MRSIRKFIDFCFFGKNVLFVVYTVLLLVTAVFLFYRSAAQTESSLDEQLFREEALTSRAGAKSIGFFLLDTGRTLELLARKPNVISMTSQAQGALERFIADWKDTPIAAVIIADSQGRVLFDANRDGTTFQKGISISDRDYFSWAKTAKQGEVFFGKAVVSRLGMTKGQYIIPVTTPIVENGRFRGVLTTVILVSDLTRQYAEPLKIFDNTQVYMVSSEGQLLVSYYPQLTGLNMLDYLDSHPFPGSGAVISYIRNWLGTKSEGKADFTWPDLKNGSKMTRFLLTFSPIFLDDNKWWLVVATPAERVNPTLAPFYNDQLIVLIFIIISILGFGIIGITMEKIAERRAYLRGLNHGRKPR